MGNFTSVNLASASLLQTLSIYVLGSTVYRRDLVLINKTWLWHLRGHWPLVGQDNHGWIQNYLEVVSSWETNR